MGCQRTCSLHGATSKASPQDQLARPHTATPPETCSKHTLRDARRFFTTRLASVPLPPLQVKTTSGWAPLGGTPAQLSCSVVPCTRTRLDLFDKLRAAPEPVLREGTWGLVRCFHDEVDGFPVQDMLRELILHDDSPNAEALSAEERSEFLWRLLCHVALGGAMNQFEDSLEPYRGAVKMVYKDLLSCASKTCVRAHACVAASVQLVHACIFHMERHTATQGIALSCRVKKSAVGELEVASAVYSVDHLVMEGEPALFPAASRNNFCYLVVDPARKLCRVLYHAYGTVW